MALSDLPRHLYDFTLRNALDEKRTLIFIDLNVTYGPILLNTFYIPDLFIKSNIFIGSHLRYFLKKFILIFDSEIGIEIGPSNHDPVYAVSTT